MRVFRSSRLVLIAMLFAITASCTSSSGAATVAVDGPVNQEGAVLTVGSIADDPRDEIAIFTPFVDYVASQMSDLGYGSGRVVVAASIDEMSDLIESGEVDIYLDSVYPAAVVNQATSAELKLKRWKKGVREYHSVLFVRADSTIQSVDDLVGHTVAFEEEFSTSGYRLPLMLIIASGLKTVQLASASANPLDDAVGYIFTGDDENTVSWVLRSRVSVGAMGAGDFEELTALQGDEFRIIARSATVPRQVVLFAANLDPSVVERIEQILLGMNNTADGEAVLQEFEATTKFESIEIGQLDDLLRSLLSGSSP